VAVVPVAVANSSVTLNMYAYEQALYTDPGKAGHPYALLQRDKVGPARPRTYQALVMRNEYLELTLLPELGGRIYQCRYLPTGQAVFYNNATIKPTHWGPPDQGWWLAVGGMEFCLPVDEHGYLTAEPWQAETTRAPDGSVTVTMRVLERSRNIEARQEITLRPGEAGFHLRTTLRNPDAQAKSVQYWINAMLAPGAHSVQPSLRFYYPASEVIVHSRGDQALPDAHATLPWPIYNGRDLSLYANWQNWLGFFAPNLHAPFTAVYDEAAQLGMVRVFPSGVARGAKLFGFGRGFGDTGAYTDDGSQYVEMWGGLTPTFWDYATLAPQASLTWEEGWYVLARSGGPSVATGDAALSVARSASQLDVTVASPGQHAWTLHVAKNGQDISTQRLSVRPDAPFHIQVPLASGDASIPLTMSLTDTAGKVILTYNVP
jgi:hypothetical protein